MANEIRGTATLQVTRNGLTHTGTNTATVSMTGSNYNSSVMTIGTSYEELPTGSCGTVRYLYVKNESTASVEFANNSTSNSFATLRPSDALILPGSGSHKQYYVKSTAAGADIQYIIVEI